MNKNKILLVAEALTLAAALAACGGGSSSTEASGAAATDTSASTASGNTPATTLPGADGQSPSLSVAQAAPTAGLSPACAAMYAASPNFALNSSRTVLNDGTPAKPARGVAFAEPNFKTCITRATHHVADGADGFAQNEYSRREAFNVNNTLQLVVDAGGYWHVYDANTHAHLTKLPSLGQDPELQWDPAHPDMLFAIPSQGVDMKLMQVNARTGVVTEAVNGNYGPQVKALWPNAGLAFTHDEGSPSKDGRFWCFMAMQVPARGDWIPLGVFAWDRQANKITSHMPLNGEQPDHVSMSPSGKYCVVSSDGSLGTVALQTTDFTKRVQLHHKSEHSDIGIDAAGRDVYVSVSYETSSETTRSAVAKTANLTSGEVFSKFLDTGEKTALFSIWGQDPGAMHFSAKNYNRPGWAVISTYADSGDNNDPGDGPQTATPTQWMQRKVLAVQLKANPTIYNLAFTVFPYESGNSPKASVNRDFTRIAFNSSFKQKNYSTVNGVSFLDADAYTIEIPSDALKDIGGPSTPPADPGTPPVVVTPPPDTTPLTVTLDSASRTGYTMKFQVSTNVAAHCRDTWSSGNSYAMLSDNLTVVADPAHLENTGKVHKNDNFGLGSASAQTVYVVCKADAASDEKQVTVSVQ